MRVDKIHRAFPKGCHPLRVIRRQLCAVLDADVIAMKIPVVTMGLKLVRDIVADCFHPLIAHPLAEMRGDIIRIGRLHHIGQRRFILPLQLTLQRQHIMHERVPEPPGRFAKLNAFARRRAGGRWRVGVGKLHATLGQRRQMRGLMKITRRIRITLHHPHRRIRPAQIIDIKDHNIRPLSCMGKTCQH